MQYATAKAGVILVNINPAYRTTELEYALRQSGCRMLVAARRSRPRDYVAMVEEVRPALPGARARRVPRRAGVGRAAWRPASASTDGELARARRRARSSTTRSTSSTRAGRPASPRARRSATTTSSTTATSSARAAATPSRTASASRCPSTTASAWSWATSACTTHGACMVIPAPAFEPGAVLATVQDERCTSLYGVPTMFIAELEHPDFADVRPDVAAHRDHGRLAVPGRGHAPRDRRGCTWRR